MAHLDLQAEFIGQPLQLQPPQAHPVAVAAAAVGSDEQPLGSGVHRLPISSHQRRMLCTANSAVSWSIPTLTQPMFAVTS